MYKTNTAHYNTRMLLTLLIMLGVILPLLTPMSLTTQAAGTLANWSEVADTSWYTVANAQVPGSASVIYEYYINSAEQLAGLAQLVNAGTSFSGKIIKLTSNIYLSGRQWTPIGTATNPFLGTFTGKHGSEIFAIFDLTIDTTATQNRHIGLFGVLGRSPGTSPTPVRVEDPAIVEHVRLIDPVIWVITTGAAGVTYSVGGIVGRNNGSILYSSINRLADIQEVSARGFRGVGGICGENHGIVQECYNEGIVTGFDGSNLSGAGGIVGENRYGGVVENCYNAGTVNATSKRVGGIVGYNSEGALVNRVYNVGEITISVATIGFGGICGINDGNIDYASYWFGDKEQRINGIPIDEGSTSRRKQGVGGGTGNANGIVRLDGSDMNDSSCYVGFIYTPLPPDTWDFALVPGIDDYPQLVNVPDIPVSFIEYVNIYVTPPRIGATPSYVVRSSTRGFEIADVEWVGVLGGLFANTSYTVRVTLDAKSLFRFDTATILGAMPSVVYINGVPATIVSINPDRIILSRAFTSLDGSISLTVLDENQPKNTTIVEGASVNLSVQASASNLSYPVNYEWFQNVDGIPVSLTSSLPTNNTLTIPAADLLLSGSPYHYYCQITQTAPGAVLQSHEAVITVLPRGVSDYYLDPWEWDFSSATFGYGEQRPRNVRITNTTATRTPTLTITVYGDDQMFNHPQPASMFGIYSGANDSFSIAPAIGLPVGIYFANVKVEELSISIDISFEVLPRIQDTPNIEIDFISETLIGFDPDETYTISQGGIPIPSFAKFTGVAEIEIFDLLGVWTSDQLLEIVKNGVDPIPPATVPDVLDSAVQTLIIPKRPDPPTGLAGVLPTKIRGKDGKITGTTIQMEYSKTPPGIDTWYPCEAVETIDVEPDVYEVRYRANPGINGNFRSLSAPPVTVPPRPGPLEATPTSLIDYEKETLINLTPLEEYFINGEIVVADDTGVIEILEEWFDTTIELIKVGKGDGLVTGDSDPQMLVIKARQPTPLSTVVLTMPPETILGTYGKITGMMDDMEYKAKNDDLFVIIDSGSPLLADNWIDYMSPSEVEAQIGFYLVRYKASNILEEFCSLPLEIEVKPQAGTPEPTPTATIDFINEKLTNLVPGASYRINYAAIAVLTDPSGEIVIGEAWMGTTISIVKMGDGTTTINSESQNLPIPARPAVPKLSAEAPVTYAGMGVIKDTFSIMEYRAAGGADVWTSCLYPETTVPPGDYEVRVRAVAGIGGNFKSLNALITVPEWTADPEPTPEVTIDYIDEKLMNFDEDASYTIKINDIEQLVNGGTVFTGVDEIDIDPTWMDEIINIIRKGDGVLTRDSEPQVISLDRPEPPNNLTGVPPTSAGMSARISGTTTDMEYRAYENPQPFPPIPWQSCSNPTTFVGDPGVYEVRIKAVAGENGNFAGKSAIIIISEYTAPPESITFEAVQVGGASGVADSTGIELTFNRSIAGLGLTAQHIIIESDTGEVVKGELTGSGRIYTINFPYVITEGDVKVSIENLSTYIVTGKPSDPVTVRVYKNTSGMSIFVGAQSGLLTTGTAGSARFTVTTSGIAPGSSITLMNLNSVTGITMDAAATVGNTTYITIRTTTVTPPGNHPLRLSINGIRSNVFYLVIDPTQSVTPPITTYSVVVLGSETGNSGNGLYSPGEAVTIRAGMRNGFSFSGWTSVNGLTFEDANSPVTVFIMPAANVTVSANWGSAISDYVIFSAEQIGGADGKTNSTGIQFTFDKPITGITAGHISITNGTGAVFAGTLSGTGNIYTLMLTNVMAQGTINVSIANFGTYMVANNPQLVQIYRDANARRITVGYQSGQLHEGALGQATFNVNTENIPSGSSIRLNNPNGSIGISLNTTNTTGNNTTVAIRTTTTTPQGQYPLTLTIDGVTSNTFTLSVGAPGSSSANTYSVIINDSSAAQTGSGRYSPGQLVTIHAGTRGDYGFTGWTTANTVAIAQYHNPTSVFIMPAHDVTINANWQASTNQVTFTATQIGGSSGYSNSTAIRLSFNQYVSGLTEGHITISNAGGSVVRGSLTGSGSTYTINLANVTSAGNVNVNVANFGSYTVTNNPQQVNVHWDNVSRRITVGTQNGTIDTGTSGQASFYVTTQNISNGSRIQLENINSVYGISLNTTSTTSNYTTVAINATNTTPQGAHPLRLTIGGISSDVFYLVIGTYNQSTTGTYTVTVNGSYASVTGSGRYTAGQIVILHAGNRANYSFNGWSSSGGATLLSPNNATTTFVMPATNVTITANWTATGTISGGTGTGAGTGSGSSYGSSGWATGMIDLAIAAGLVPQQLRSNYTADITRAEYSALVVTLYETLSGRVVLERYKFSDTEDEYVEKAAAMGFVNGVGGNRFNPTGLLTREEAALIIVRMATQLGWTLPQRSISFVDNNEISPWAINAVEQVYAAGIMSGVAENTFAPKSQVTREQSIVIMFRMYDGRR